MYPNDVIQHARVGLVSTGGVWGRASGGGCLKSARYRLLAPPRLSTAATVSAQLYHVTSTSNNWLRTSIALSDAMVSVKGGGQRGCVHNVASEISFGQKALETLSTIPCRTV